MIHIVKHLAEEGLSTEMFTLTACETLTVKQLQHTLNEEDFRQIYELNDNLISTINILIHNEYSVNSKLFSQKISGVLNFKSVLKNVQWFITDNVFQHVHIVAELKHVRSALNRTKVLLVFEVSVKYVLTIQKYRLISILKS